MVKHEHEPQEISKMQGQKQTKYFRKNWSSLILWNCEHSANLMLTPEKINSLSGQWLHGFSWLEDSEIGELPQEWNWLSGISPKSISPSAVHFTRGIPSIPGYKNSFYADEWFAILAGA